MKKKNIVFPWWIIGLICPIVGIVLFILWKNKRRKDANNIIIGSIIGLFVYLFLVIILGSNGISIENKTVDSWYNDITSGKQTVTVIGSSTCSHCQEYKPVIKALAKKYKFNLYFFESDTLSSEDSDKLFNSFELKDYNGYVPYTFIFENNEYVNGIVGFADKSATIEYFKEYGVIKN